MTDERDATTTRTEPRSALWGIGTLLALLLATGLTLGLREPSAEIVTTDAVVRIDQGGLRLTFQPVTGDLALFDLTTDPDCLDNLAEERPEEVERLTLRLLADLGMSSLDELRAPHAETIERLRSLGYF